MAVGISDALDRLDDDESLRVGVLTGTSASHLVAKCSSSTDKAMLANSGERIPPCRVPVWVPLLRPSSDELSAPCRRHQSATDLPPAGFPRSLLSV